MTSAADFAQTYYRRLAAADGFDDALLSGPGGVISEGGIANSSGCWQAW
jgi:branched-subunit amino acid aminotransferase/4-amino-4-deoxychorismate lyase